MVGLKLICVRCHSRAADFISSFSVGTTHSQKQRIVTTWIMSFCGSAVQILPRRQKSRDTWSQVRKAEDECALCPSLSSSRVERVVLAPDISDTNSIYLLLCFCLLDSDRHPL